MATMVSWPTWLSLPTPNDARPQQVPRVQTTTKDADTHPQLPPATPAREPTIIQRNRPLSLMLFGTAMVFFSVRATRRAMLKRNAAVRPHFWHPSNEQPINQVSGPFEAVEALSLATVNVASWAIFMTGGLMWAFNINKLDDMRRQVRGGLGLDDDRPIDSEAEKEIERWVASVFNSGMEGKLGKDALQSEEGEALLKALEKSNGKEKER